MPRARVSPSMSQRCSRRFLGDVRRSARAVSSTPRRRAACRVTHHVHPVARGAQGEELSIDVAVLGRADAHEVLVPHLGTHGAEGFCGSGCQVDFLRDDAFVTEVENAGVRVVFLHALNPYGFSHIRAHQRGQHRPQSQLPRFLAADRRRTRPTPKCTASWCRRRGRPPPENEGRLMAYIAGARRAGAAERDERRPVRISRRAVLRRRAPGVEQHHLAQGAAGARRRARARWARSTSIPGSGRAGTARRSWPRATWPTMSHAPRHGGATT